MHQRRKLTLCLVAGVLVLAVSAAAAFGSVNGYDRYKQAVKQLLTQEENLTLQAQVNLAMDGAEVFAWQGTYEGRRCIETAGYVACGGAATPPDTTAAS